MTVQCSAEEGRGSRGRAVAGGGWRWIRAVPPPAEHAPLTVAGLDAALEEIGRTRGPGSQARRHHLISTLFAAATDAEQRYLRGLLTGEVRQGALAGVATEAVAAAFDVPASEVRRALLLSGDLRAVAAA